MPATEAYFRSLADSLGQLVWVVDRAGRLSYGNLAWQSFTQIHVGTSFLESYLPALHPTDRSSWERTWERAVSSGEPYELELALARHLVELHGGKVDAYSEGPGRGSEFVVRLPGLRASVGSCGPLAKTDDSSVPM